MIFKVNDLFYVCTVGRWREGFTHKVQICNKFGEPLVRSCTKYYNRTWEKYNFQSAMMRAQTALERKLDLVRKALTPAANRANIKQVIYFENHFFHLFF